VEQRRFERRGNLRWQRKAELLVLRSERAAVGEAETRGRRTALSRLADSGLARHGEIELLCTVDEEYLKRGVMHARAQGLTAAAAIIAEASLSFLGLGQQPPAPSWGSMLNAAQRYLVQAPWMAIYPGLMIFGVVMSLNVVGDALRDALDPKHQ